MSVYLGFFFWASHRYDLAQECSFPCIVSLCLLEHGAVALQNSGGMVSSVQYMSASNSSTSFYLFSYPIYHSFTDSVTADQSTNRSLREKERNVWLGRAKPGASVCRRWGLQQSPGFGKRKPAVLAAFRIVIYSAWVFTSPALQVSKLLWFE